MESEGKEPLSERVERAIEMGKTNRQKLIWNGDQNELLSRNVRGILNKLTRRNISFLASRIRQFPIENVHDLSNLAEIVVEKAAREPSFSKVFARTCLALEPMEVTEAGKVVTFKEILTDLCLNKFHEEKEHMASLEGLLASGNGTSMNLQEKGERMKRIEEFQRRRRKSLGLVEFLGELYKMSLVSTDTVFDFLDRLMSKSDDKSVECLCELLRKIGRELECKSYSSKQSTKDWDGYFGRLSELSEKNESWRVKEILELKANDWIPECLRRPVVKLPEQMQEAKREQQVSKGAQKREQNVEHMNRFDLLIEKARLNQQKLSRKGNQNEIMSRKVRGILNKLTPENFNTLAPRMRQLWIDDVSKLSRVAAMVLEKATAEPLYAKEYARLCRSLASMEAPPIGRVIGETEKVSFEKIMIDLCLKEFQEKKELTDNVTETTDLEEKREVRSICEDGFERRRKRNLVRFMGELCKLSVIPSDVMLDCTKALISKSDEGSLERLCSLLTTAGKELEERCLAEKQLESDWNGYFERMLKLSKKDEDSKVSLRVRFMLQDVLELKANNWNPRRAENSPKKFKQIKKDYEQEMMEIGMKQKVSNKTKKNKQKNPGGGSNLVGKTRQTAPRKGRKGGHFQEEERDVLTEEEDSSTEVVEGGSGAETIAAGVPTRATTMGDSASKINQAGLSKTQKRNLRREKALAEGRPPLTKSQRRKPRPDIAVGKSGELPHSSGSNTAAEGSTKKIPRESSSITPSRDKLRRRHTGRNTEEDLKIAVVPSAYPEDRMTLECKKEFEEKATTAIFDTEEGQYFPQFYSSYLKGGALVITCATRESVEWLETLAKETTLSNGWSLRTGVAKDVLRSAEVSTSSKGRNEDSIAGSSCPDLANQGNRGRKPPDPLLLDSGGFSAKTDTQTSEGEPLPSTKVEDQSSREAESSTPNREGLNPLSDADWDGYIQRLKDVTGTKQVAPSLKEVGNEHCESTGTRKRDDRFATSIMVTNLSERVQLADVQDLAKPFGVCKKVFVARDKATGLCKGYAYIHFRSRKEASAAIAALHGHKYDDLILGADWSKPQTE